MYCYAKFCRLCLQRSDNLFDFNTKDADNITIIKKIMILMPSLILTNANFPSLICQKCREKLFDSYNFINNCYVNNETLLKYKYQFDCNCENIDDNKNCEFSINLEKLNNKENDKSIKRHCSICNYTFTTLSSLRKHLNLHNVAKYTCIICEEKFADFTSFDKHRNIHYTTKPKRLKLTVRRAINQHENPLDNNKKQNNTPDTATSTTRAKTSQKKPHVCHICGKSFCHLQNLRRHHESVHLKIRYNCEMCNKMFTEMYSLRYHQKTVHQQIKRYECHVCKKKISSAKDLRSHLRSQHKEAEPQPPPQTNAECMRADRDMSATKTEDATDTNKCHICAKTFSSKQGLKRHNDNIHLKRRYKCDICSKLFNCSSSLRFHKLTVHLKIKKYECHVCKKKFTKSFSLKTHLQIHERDSKCTICKRVFATIKELNEHCTSHNSTEQLTEPDHDISEHSTEPDDDISEQLTEPDHDTSEHLLKTDHIIFEQIQIKSECFS